MAKVKTFGQVLRIFKTHRELEELDQHVNEFLASGEVKKVISVSDAVLTGEEGTTQGVIRVVTYE